jgi:hypothetical protein
MAKSEAVETKLTGAETIEQAVAVLKKHYDNSTVISMLNRGEYDVLYRQGRREVTSEQRKAQKRRLDLLEKEFVARGGKLEELNAKLK